MVRPSFGSHTRPRAWEGGGRKFKAEKEKIGPQETRANRRARVVEGALATRNHGLQHGGGRGGRIHRSPYPSISPCIYPSWGRESYQEPWGLSVGIRMPSHQALAGQMEWGAWACIRAKGCIHQERSFFAISRQEAALSINLTLVIHMDKEQEKNEGRIRMNLSSN